MAATFLLDPANLAIGALAALIPLWLREHNEAQKIRALLFTLCVRYFSSTLNSIDLTSNRIKDDQLTKKQHQAEVTKILEDLDSISSGAKFAQFVASNELSVMFGVQLRRELTEHLESPSFGLNQGSIKQALNLYDWCCTLPRGFVLSRHKTIGGLAKSMRVLAAANE